MDFLRKAPENGCGPLPEAEEKPEVHPGKGCLHGIPNKYDNELSKLVGSVH